MTIKLTEEQRKLRITRPEDVYPILREIYTREYGLGLDKEYFWVIGIDPSGTLLYVELVALGSANRIYVTPTDVYSFALTKRAGTIIIAHNHPGGSMEFSPQDLDMTDKMIQIGKLVNIDLVDHMIITGNGFTSLRMLGLYEELYNNKRYVSSYILHEIDLVKERAKVRQELAAERKTIAQKMYDKKMALPDIAEILQVEVFDIERILDL